MVSEHEPAVDLFGTTNDRSGSGHAFIPSAAKSVGPSPVAGGAVERAGLRPHAVPKGRPTRKEKGVLTPVGHARESLEQGTPFT